MFTVKLFAAIIAAAAVSIPAGISAQPAEVKENDARVIVEVDAGLDGLSEQGIINTQNAVISNIKRYVNPRVKLEQRYSVLANAFLLDVNSDDVDAIKEIEGVKSVTLDTLHFTETYDGAETITITKEGSSSSEYKDSDNISAITMNAPESSNEGEGIAIAILDNEFAINCKVELNNKTYTYTHEAYNALPSGTKTKYTKESVRAIVDANKDTFHGVYGSKASESTYYNTKVPFYYDYGGDVTSPSAQGMPDYDTSSDTAAHGSHVASIAAGNGDTYKGIAPKAQLICMKVFTIYNPTEAFKKLGAVSSSGAYDSAIFAALEDCITLGVDAINMSLGSDLDDFDQDSLTLRTLNSLQEHGIIACIAAGNSGKTAYNFTGAYGNWTSEMVETGILSSYANSQTSMTIASAVPLATFYEDAMTVAGSTIAYNDQVVNRDDDDTTYREEDEKELWDLTEGGTKLDFDYVKVPNFGEAKDYADINVKNKIAVVDRGSIDFATKVQNAVSAGAIAVVIVDNDPTATEFTFRCSFGDDYVPPVPVVLTLYKNRPTWVNNPEGTFHLIQDQILDNDDPYTMSTFSSDGADYTYSLKPDIATPGDGIKGAIPPTDKKKYNDPTQYSTLYAYYSGTSMATPNYCGAIALLLGEHLDDLEEYKASVCARTQSTADPMTCTNDHDETVYTSPRQQGAGMIDISGALNSSVYLEGLDVETGEETGYGKICLYNSDSISKGEVSLSFAAHNEGRKSQTYKATTYIYRPDITSNNEVIQTPYNKVGTATTYVELVGSANVPEYFDAAHTIKNEDYCADPYGGNYEKGVDTSLLSEYDAYAVTTIPENYYTYGWVSEGYKAFYLNSDKQWTPVPQVEYQSTKDTLIAEVTQEVTIAPGDSKITLNTYTLTSEQKAEIDSFYTDGCAIEGYVILESVGTGSQKEETLSLPFLGFYGDYAEAPAVEPFSFEKESGKVYGSDLVNDFAKNTMGYDNADLSSMWLVGYSESPGDVYTSKVVKNEANFKQWTEGVNANWYEVGSDALTGETLYDEDGNIKIYVGNTSKSNTMIIQQFVNRSCSSNIITIKDEAGNVVYEGYAEEMIGYGEESELYKSHVIGNVYVAHRALAIIPLYNTRTKEAFADGEYTMTMAYTLAGVKDDATTPEKENVQTLTYKLIVDNTDPEISTTETTGNIATRDASGNVTGHTTGKVLRTIVKEENLSYLVYNNTNVTARTSDDPDEEGYYGFYPMGDGTYAYDIPASDAAAVTEKNKGRLAIEAVDEARGHTGYILRDYQVGKSANGLAYIEGSDITSGYNFELQINSAKNALMLRVFTYDAKGNEVDVDLDEPITLVLSMNDYLGLSNANGLKVYDGVGDDKALTSYTTESYVDSATGQTKMLIKIQTSTGRISVEQTATPAKSGCGGSIAITGSLVAVFALAGIILALVAEKKRKLIR